MASIETYRKHAKELVRRHEQRKYLVGEKARLLERYRLMSGEQILDAAMPLTVAQEIVAVQAGFRDWDELRTAAMHEQPPEAHGVISRLRTAVPILFVSDVAAAARWYDRLGFTQIFCTANRRSTGQCRAMMSICIYGWSHARTSSSSLSESRR